MTAPPLEVARAMIQAGIQVASGDGGMAIEEALDDEDLLGDEELGEHKTVH